MLSEPRRVFVILIIKNLSLFSYISNAVNVENKAIDENHKTFLYLPELLTNLTTQRKFILFWIKINLLLI